MRLSYRASDAQHGSEEEGDGHGQSHVRPLRPSSQSTTAVRVGAASQGERYHCAWAQDMGPPGQVYDAEEGQATDSTGHWKRRVWCAQWWGDRSYLLRDHERGPREVRLMPLKTISSGVLFIRTSWALTFYVFVELSMRVCHLTYSRLAHIAIRDILLSIRRCLFGFGLALGV